MVGGAGYKHRAGTASCWTPNPPAGTGGGTCGPVWLTRVEDRTGVRCCGANPVKSGMPPNPSDVIRVNQFDAQESTRDSSELEFRSDIRTSQGFWSTSWLCVSGSVSDPIGSQVPPRFLIWSDITLIVSGSGLASRSRSSMKIRSTPRRAISRSRTAWGAWLSAPAQRIRPEYAQSTGTAPRRRSTREEASKRVEEWGDEHGRRRGCHSPRSKEDARACCPCAGHQPVFHPADG